MTTDTDIRDAVISELGYERSIPTGTLRVTCDNGYVTIAGAVDTSDQRAAAENAARRVDGVLGLNCEVTLRPTDANVIAPN